jgi:cyclooctatin synthase
MSSTILPRVSGTPSAPGRIPLLGHALNLRFRPLDFFFSLANHGDVVSFRIGGRVAYFINSPQLVRQILTTQYHNFGKGGTLYASLRKLLGNGLITADSESHRRHRRLMQPAFHPTRLADYATIMSDSATAAVESWRDGESLDVPKEMLGLATTVAVKSLFSASTTADAVAEIQRAMPVLAHGVGQRTRTPFEILYRLPLPANRRYDDACRRVNLLIERVIADYRATGVERGDLLSMLLAARDEDTGQGMSDGQIHDECVSLLVAGTETTATTLSWVWHVLGSRPGIEESVHYEVDRALDGRPARYEDFAKLEYLQRVITEALRMYPPAWLTTRTANVDVDLGDHRIPAGADVFISPYVIQRNPEVYPDPDRFDPDRWLPDRHGNPQRESYLPFGGGIRICIGNTFALVEAVITIGTLAGRWRLRAAPGQNTRAKAEATLHPNSLAMITERRR